MIEKHYVEVKSIRKNTGLPDTYFISKFGFSPYKACQHSCKYCDGRSEKYYVEGDFEKDITIRKNLPEVLDTSLKKFRERGIIGISSGVSDPYQPVEASEKIMTTCAEIIGHHGYPAMLFTKSNMVMRDIDLWEQVHKKAGFTLMMSLVYHDDEIRKKFEPYASSVQARLKTLKAFKDRGMSVGVLAMPILPFLTDHPDQLIEMTQTYQSIGVDCVMPGSMTLRPGINKNTYFDIIEKYYPELLLKYKHLYGENRASGASRNTYSDHLHKTFGQIITGHGIPEMIPHKLYKNRMPIYDEVYILLTHMMSLYHKRGVNVDALALARKGYGQWLSHEKAYYNRRRNLGFDELESKVINMIDNNTIMEHFNNEKLTTFFKQVVIEQKVLNYITLKLEPYER